MALYEQLVTDEMICRWHIPLALEQASAGLNEYSKGFTASVQGFVKAHPGVTPYMLRRMAAKPTVIEKIVTDQAHAAHAYGIASEQARWLLATEAFHCITAADTM